ncbi:MAG: hypothetical protein HY823_03190 [Acidobacteria bacterium]|nr:hypothetical protein [Acidobacteriota bacterium]
MGFFALTWLRYGVRSSEEQVRRIKKLKNIEDLFQIAFSDPVLPGAMVTYWPWEVPLAARDRFTELLLSQKEPLPRVATQFIERLGENDAGLLDKLGRNAEAPVVRLAAKERLEQVQLEMRESHQKRLSDDRARERERRRKRAERLGIPIHFSFVESSTEEKASYEGYMEVPRPDADGFCSLNSCPCDEVMIPRGTGFLWISETAVQFRHDARTAIEAEAKARFLSMDLFDLSVPGRISPVLVCLQGARKLHLDLDVASGDAKHWWETGQAPLRPTPRFDSAMTNG